MSDVVPFPGATPAPEVRTELDPNEVHAPAFRDLEGEVSDLDRMAEIARDLIMNCAAKEDSLPRLGAGHLCRLATGEDGERVQDQLSKTLVR